MNGINFGEGGEGERNFFTLPVLQFGIENGAVILQVVPAENEEREEDERKKMMRKDDFMVLLLLSLLGITQVSFD